MSSVTYDPSVVSRSRSFSMLTEHEKELVILWEAKKIITKLRSLKKDDWYGLNVSMVSNWQRLAYSEFYGIKFDKWELEEVRYNLLSEIRTQARDECRKMLYPKDLDSYQSSMVAYFQQLGE